MGDFRKLVVWREARDLTVLVYRLTDRFPVSERYGLTQQMRRAAVSVSSNIAEGAGRGKPRAFHGFLRIARGSLHEVRSQLYLSVMLGFVTRECADPVLQRAERTSRLLSGMLRESNPRD